MTGNGTKIRIPAAGDPAARTARILSDVFAPAVSVFLICVLCGVMCTMGVMGWLDEPISLGTLVLPSLLIVIGSSYATHVVSRYYRHTPIAVKASALPR